MSQPPFLHHELLARFGPGAASSCGCGAEHRLLTREVVFGDGALARSAELLASRYGRPVVYALSDENTERAAGVGWKASIRARHLHSRILPASPKPAPTQSLVDMLVAEVRGIAPQLIVSIGSGVLSDLGKKVALEAGVPSWCIATAASVDAYTSATAAVHVDGYHRALPARVSETVVCDLDVIARAPRVLLLAGLGDMLAKFLAQLDWIMASRVAGEAFCATLASLALAAARQSLEAAEHVDRDPTTAVRLLTDASLVSGLAMQAFGSSRPAASAEHTVAHFWDSAGAVKTDSMALHGLEVGAAMRLVLPGYRAFYGSLGALQVDVEARSAALEDDALLGDRLEDGARPFAARIAEERRARVFDRAVLARRLAAFERGRGDLAAAATPLLAEIEAAMRSLERLGFPFSPQELGIAPGDYVIAARYARLLRNRYTTFDLAYELGQEDSLLCPIAAASVGSEP